MKVYILRHIWYSEQEILGVYRSEADAQRAIPVGKGSQYRNQYEVAEHLVIPRSK